MNRAVCYTACLIIVSTRADARVYSPRVLSPHNADTYSMKTFAQFHRWRDLKGDAKVFEIYKYLVDRRTGIYPLGTPAREGSEELSEFGAVREAVKMLNVYPIGHCGTLGPTMAGVMQDMGIGPARTLILPGWNHVAAEVFYDRRWHYLDLDVRAVFRRQDGSLASMQQSQTDASLWQRPNSPLFFPLDPLNRVRDVYARTPVSHRHGLSTGGHTMDFVLRQGETFTRWWQPQGGRWNHHPSYVSSAFRRKLFEQAPRGPKCKHASFTIHTHGNGRFVYKPDLTADSNDFADGAYDSHNVVPSTSGLMLKEQGQGHAVFEVRSPYVIVPLVGDFDTTADDREASTVKIDATGAALFISRDNGLTWTEVEVGRIANPTSKDGRISNPSYETVDLTPYASGTYGYLLKIVLRGEPERAMVRSLEITTWVQVHPASLPSLRTGTNRMQFVTGDHYGLPTRVVEFRPDASNRDELLKYLAVPPDDYDPSRATSRIRGPFVVKVPAPPAAKIAWFSAGANFRTHQKDAARQTRNTIAYAADEPKGFRKVYRADVPTDQDHWHYNADREVRLNEPTTMLYVRYLGDPAVNNVRIYAHCMDDRSQHSQAVHVKHVWIEGDERKTRIVKLSESPSYEIVTEAEPTDVSVELSVPANASSEGKMWSGDRFDNRRH